MNSSCDNEAYGLSTRDGEEACRETTDSSADSALAVEAVCPSATLLSPALAAEIGCVSSESAKATARAEASSASTAAIRGAELEAFDAAPKPLPATWAGGMLDESPMAAILASLLPALVPRPGLGLDGGEVLMGAGDSDSS
jgi:hypothetical protein